MSKLDKKVLSCAKILIESIKNSERKYVEDTFFLLLNLLNSSKYINLTKHDVVVDFIENHRSENIIAKNLLKEIVNSHFILNFDKVFQTFLSIAKDQNLISVSSIKTKDEKKFNIELKIEVDIAIINNMLIDNSLKTQLDFLQELID